MRMHLVGIFHNAQGVVLSHYCKESEMAGDMILKVFKHANTVYTKTCNQNNNENSSTLTAADFLKSFLLKAYAISRVLCIHIRTPVFNTYHPVQSMDCT